jgi:hypothetical protein
VRTIPPAPSSQGFDLALGFAQIEHVRKFDVTIKPIKAERNEFIQIRFHLEAPIAVERGVFAALSPDGASRKIPVQTTRCRGPAQRSAITLRHVCNRLLQVGNVQMSQMSRLKQQRTVEYLNN